MILSERFGTRDIWGYRPRDAESGGRRGAAPIKSVPPSIWGLGGDKILGAKWPKFGAEVAFLENVSEFSEKFFLKNAMKSKIFVKLNFKKNFVFFRKIVA